MLDKIIGVILFPYSLVLKCRADRYRKYARGTEVPTICIGNVTVGGTGKTPHTEMILDLLQHSDRWGAKNLAVLSRGYKRRSKGFRLVVRDGSAAESGDEPLQIKRKFPSVTVAVDKNRMEGCDLLCHPGKAADSDKFRSCCHTEYPAADLIVLDDALQYIRLRADVNILIIDYNRPLDEDNLLPFGSLRDLPDRMNDADIIIVSKCPVAMDEDDMEDWQIRLGLEDRSKLFFTTIEYDQLQPVFPGADSRYLYSKKAIMVTGVANDKPLLKHLSDSYKIIGRFAFPDHHRYALSDFDRILAMERKDSTSVIVTTEKDTQRILDVNGLPGDIRLKMFYCPIRVGFHRDTEKERFSALLLSLLSDKRAA